MILLFASRDKPAPVKGIIEIILFPCQTSPGQSPGVFWRMNKITATIGRRRLVI